MPLSACLSFLGLMNWKSIFVRLIRCVHQSYGLTEFVCLFAFRNITEGMATRKVDRLDQQILRQKQRARRHLGHCMMSSFFCSRHAKWETQSPHYQMYAWVYTTILTSQEYLLMLLEIKFDRKYKLICSAAAIHPHWTQRLIIKVKIKTKSFH